MRQISVSLPETMELPILPCINEESLLIFIGMMEKAYIDKDGFFVKVGKIGKSLGLKWGGTWKSIVDKPYFQLHDWGSGPAKLKKLYGTPDKFMKTWQQ